jgi:hypothetical protein
MLNKLTFSRRLKTFWANWGGLFIATILVIIAFVFLGIYLYSSSRVNNTLAWVTQDITLAAIGQTKQIEDPPSAVYHFILLVNNPTVDSATVTISDIKVNLDEFELVATPYGSWEKSIESNGKTSYEGEFTLTAETLNTFIERETVHITVTGTINARCQYWTIERESERPINIATTIGLNNG